MDGQWTRQAKRPKTSKKMAIGRIIFSRHGLIINGYIILNRWLTTNWVIILLSMVNHHGLIINVNHPIINGCIEHWLLLNGTVSHWQPGILEAFWEETSEVGCSEVTSGGCPNFSIVKWGFCTFLPGVFPTFLPGQNTYPRVS